MSFVAKVDGSDVYDAFKSLAAAVSNEVDVGDTLQMTATIDRENGRVVIEARVMRLPPP